MPITTIVKCGTTWDLYILIFCKYFPFSLLYILYSTMSVSLVFNGIFQGFHACFIFNTGIGNVHKG